MLEAKLLGFTVLRADSIEAQRGDYGGVRALAARLLESAPEAALAAARPRIGLLGHALPELLERIPDVALEVFEDPQARRPRVQRALHEWFLEVSMSSPLAIGIDDVDLIDEPTAAFAALLTDGIAQRSLALVCSAQSSSADAMFGAMKVLRDASTRIALEALGTDDFSELVRSLFGEVPHLQTLAHKLALASQGNPRDAMQLARHMIDCGTIRYASGAWSLPATVDESDLPSSIAAAHSARIASLSDESRQLALALALAPDIGVSFDEVQLLTGHADAGRLLRSLDELLVAGIISSAARRFSLSQRGFVGLLRASVDATRTAEQQQRLALLFQKRKEPFRYAQHLLRAGDMERDADPDAYNKLLQSLPTDWFETFQAGVALCKQLGRPRMQLHTLYSRISGLIPGGLGNTEAVEA